MRPRGWAIAAAIAVVAPGTAAADDRGLRYDWKVDGAVTALAAGFWGATELLRSHLAPEACRWCGVDGVDASARSALVWSDTGAANLASSLGAYLVVPVTSVGLVALAARHDDRSGEIAGDALVIAESVALTASVSQIVKFSFGRERPFVHALPPSEKPFTSNPSDNNLSFASGHTVVAFALATASGTVASMRGYRLAPVVWAAGLAGAAAVGYLRIAADRHYLTDVVAGGALGATGGFVIPYGFHRSHGIVSLAPVPGGGGELVLSVRR